MRWFPILGMIACGTPWEEGDLAGLRTFTVDRTAGANGTVQVAFKPEADDVSLQLVVRPFESVDGADLSHLRSLEVAKEPVYRAVDEVDPLNVFARSGAGFVASTTSMSWPIAPSDGPLATGERHLFRVGLTDATRVYTDGTAEMTVVVKSDDDLTSGTLRVNLMFGGNTATDSAVQQAVDGAIEVWRSTYRSIGLELDIERTDFPQGALVAPGQGDRATYEALSGTNRPNAVNLLVLEEIVDFTGTLGFSGGIPGPIVASNLSAVLVNTTLGAGTDGRYDDAEVTLLGETMAHEVGHYMGLFHPVERTYDSWDGLDDTPQCQDDETCTEQLGSNLMFPAPICSGSTCVVQQSLTDTQAAVVHRYTGVE